LKILIVGGGPAGSLSAIGLGGEHEVLLVEERQCPGFPVQCAGLVSEECYRRLRRYSDCKLNDIEGAFFVSPKGNYASLVGRVGGVVVERKILDRDLLAKASERAEVWVKTRFLNVGERAVLVREGKRVEVDYDYVVGADGVRSSVARTFGFDRPEVLSAVQVECRYEPLDDRMVEIVFGRSYSDGFFAYAIPLGDTARIGVVSRSNPAEYLKRLLTKHPSVSKRVRGCVLELNAGAIPVGLVEFVRGRVVLIGDSAGMVKPYTGGGLYYLLLASEMLAKNFPNLEAFRSEFLSEVGREINFGMKIFRLYSKLDDEDYEHLVKLAKEHGEMARDLHMDRPSTLMKLIPSVIKIVKRPKLLRKLLSVLVT